MTAETAEGMGVPNILEGTEQFMRAAGQLESKDIGFPRNYDNSLRVLRRRLVNSEFWEYMDDGEKQNDPIETADGLLDVIVTSWGTMLAYFGPELSVLLANTVVVSNLSKILPDGTVLKDEGGKVRKDHSYFVEAKILEVLEKWDEEHGTTYSKRG